MSSSIEKPSPILPAELWALCLSYADEETQQQFGRVNKLAYDIAIDVFIQQGAQRGFIEDPYHRQMRCHLRQLPKEQLRLSYGTTDSDAIIKENPQQTRAYELSQQIERVAGWIREAYPELATPGSPSVSFSARQVVEWFFSLPLKRMTELYCHRSFIRNEKNWGDWKAFLLFEERVLQHEDKETIIQQKWDLLFIGLRTAIRYSHRELVSALLKIVLIDKVKFENYLTNHNDIDRSMVACAVYDENEELVSAFLAANAGVTQREWDRGSHMPKIRPLLLEALQKDNPRDVQFNAQQPMRDLRQELLVAIENSESVAVNELTNLFNCDFKWGDGRTPQDVACDKLALCHADSAASRQQLNNSYRVFRSLVWNSGRLVNNNSRNQAGRTLLHRLKELRSHCEEDSPTKTLLVINALKVGAFCSVVLGASLALFGALAIPSVLSGGVIIVVSLANGIPLAGLGALALAVSLAAAGFLLLILSWKACNQADSLEAQKRLSQTKREELDSLIEELKRAGALDLPDNEGICPSDIV